MRWIPDAEQEPHPFLMWLFELMFDLGIQVLYRRDVILPDDYAPVPGTLVLSNHQRRCDVPIIASVLGQRSGLRFHHPLPFLVSREDIFRSYFLRTLLVDVGWPQRLAGLFARIPLARMFRTGRVLPLRRVREFTLHETVEMLCQHGFGDQSPGRWLRPAALQRIATEKGEIPASLAELDRLPARDGMSQPWGLRRLQLTALRQLLGPFRRVIADNLQQLAGLLDEGRIVYMAPEGMISRTGRMRRPRGGAARLCHQASQATRIRPVALTYDSLAPGRPRSVVQVGPADLALDSADRRAFDTQLMRSILQLYVVNPSHLFAYWLAHGPAAFGTQNLIHWVGRALAVLAESGVALDPLFKRAGVSNLVEQRLLWMARQGLVQQRGQRWYNCWDAATPPGLESPARLVRYLVNGLQDVFAAHPGLQAQLMV